MTHLWRDHSRTIVGLALGSIICGAAALLWPEGGNAFDLTTTIGGVLFAIGCQGILDACFCEVAKAEEPVE